jgi:hypothetical protein
MNEQLDEQPYEQIKQIKTIIPFKTILDDTLKTQPNTECEFKDSLAYNAMNLLLEDLNNQLNVNDNKLLRGGVKKSKKSKRSKRMHTKRSKYSKRRTRKYRTLQYGGAHPETVLFFLSFFLIFVQGVQFINFDGIFERLQQAYEARAIFRNIYGTCTLNSLLFLKSINLQTFGDLSLQIMSGKKKMNTKDMNYYLNGQLDIKTETTWFAFYGEVSVEDYINKIKNRLIELRREKGQANSGMELITAMNYPVKNQPNGHAVIVWLTNEDDLNIIDPQLFYRDNKLLIYSTNHRYESLQSYIDDNVDLRRETEFLLSIHTEIQDSSTELSLENPELEKTLKRISPVGNLRGSREYL